MIIQLTNVFHLEVVSLSLNIYNINFFYCSEGLGYTISYISLGKASCLQYSYSEAEYLSFLLKPQFACVLK